MRRLCFSPAWRLITLCLLPGALSAQPPGSMLDTEHYRLQPVAVATGLDVPWGMAFLPDGRILVTERAGRLRVIENGRLLPAPVAGLPAVAAHGQGGLLDVALDPDFEREPWVYWSYTAEDRGRFGTEVARGRLAGRGTNTRLEDVEIIFQQQPKLTSGQHFGSRLVFDRERRLFITLGDRGQMKEAQNPEHHIGKIMRLDSQRRAEIFSLGNRNVQGAALHPTTGELWAHEHGPQGGDELNIIRQSRNYGWPVVTHGVNYGSGTRIGEGSSKSGMEPPLWTWLPRSIAPSGMTFVTSARYPRWNGQLLIGSLQAPGLVRLVLQGNQVQREERIALGRVRDVRQAPDGFIYVLSETQGALLRLEPR
ncbi:MAG: PQQ-dependent sugar dehydrogenase [Burkholderiales bacterium]|jgi:glucose/arabinose dehydrogenase